MGGWAVGGRGEGAEANFCQKLGYLAPALRLALNSLFLFTTPRPRGTRLLIPTCDLRETNLWSLEETQAPPAAWLRNAQLVPSWGSCDRGTAINIRGTSDQDRNRTPGEDKEDRVCVGTKTSPPVSFW